MPTQDSNFKTRNWSVIEDFNKRLGVLRNNPALAIFVTPGDVVTGKTVDGYDAGGRHLVFNYSDIPGEQIGDGYEPPLSSSWYNPAKREFAKRFHPNTLSKDTLRQWALTSLQKNPKNAQAQAIIESFGKSPKFPYLSGEAIFNPLKSSDVDTDQEKEGGGLDDLNLTQQDSDTYKTEREIYTSYANASNMYIREYIANTQKNDLINDTLNQILTDWQFFSGSDNGSPEYGLLEFTETDRKLILSLVNDLLVPVLNGDMRPIADFLPFIGDQKIIENEESWLKLRESMRQDLPFYTGRQDDPWRDENNDMEPYLIGLQKNIEAYDESYSSPYSRITRWKRLHRALNKDRDALLESIDPKRQMGIHPLWPLTCLGQGSQFFDDEHYNTIKNLEFKVEDLSAKHWHEVKQTGLLNADPLVVQNYFKAMPQANRPIPPLSSKAIPEKAVEKFKNFLKTSKDEVLTLAGLFASDSEVDFHEIGLTARDDILMVWMALDLFDAIQRLNTAFLSEPSLRDQDALIKVACYSLNIPYFYNDFWKKSNELESLSGDIPEADNLTGFSHTLFRASAFNGALRDEFVYADRLYSLWDTDKNQSDERLNFESERQFIGAWSVAFYQQAKQEVDTLINDTLIPWLEKYAPESSFVTNSQNSNLDINRLVQMNEPPLKTRSFAIESISKSQIDKGFYNASTDVIGDNAKISNGDSLMAVADILAHAEGIDNTDDLGSFKGATSCQELSMLYNFMLSKSSAMANENKEGVTLSAYELLNKTKVLLWSLEHALSSHVMSRYNDIIGDFEIRHAGELSEYVAYCQRIYEHYNAYGELPLSSNPSNVLYEVPEHVENAYYIAMGFEKLKDPRALLAENYVKTFTARQAKIIKNNLLDPNQPVDETPYGLVIPIKVVYVAAEGLVAMCQIPK